MKKILKHTPILSVIIPAFNSERTIVRTLKSVMKSELPMSEMEVLVVDNGSTDSTVELVHRNMQEFSNVRIIYSEKGRSNARNEGLGKANGRYITFLDADDEVTSNHYQDAVSYLEANSMMYAYMDNSRLVSDSAINLGDVTDLTGKKAVDLLKRNFIPISAVIFRNEGLISFDTNISHDEDWLFWALNLYTKSMFIAKNRYGSIIHVTGENSMMDFRMGANALYVYSKIKDAIGITAVSRVQLVKSALWFRMYYDQSTEPFVKDVQRSFKVEYGVAGLLLQVRPTKTFLNSKKTKNNARYR